MELRIAVVGCSSVARNHIPHLIKASGVRPTHILSSSNERAALFANQFNLIPCSEYEQILNNKDIDAVLIATEPARHMAFSEQGIEANKHVLIEKPLVSKIEDGETLVRLASEKGISAGVISQHRFDHGIRQFSKLLNSNKIGKPFLLSSILTWSRNEEYFRKGDGWRSNSVNVLTNHGVHMVDIINSCFGVPFTSAVVASRTNPEVKTFDTAILNMEFKDGLIGAMICTTASPVSEGMSLAVFGANGILKCWNSGSGFQSSWTVDGNRGNSGVSQMIARRFSKPPIQLQFEEFADSVREGRQPLVSLEDGLNVLRVIGEKNWSKGGFSNGDPLV